MNTPLESSALQAFKQGRTLVFPTTQAAEFWQRRLLRVSGVGAIRRSQVLAWDSFVRTYLCVDEHKTDSLDNLSAPPPAHITPALRLLFLHTHLHNIPVSGLFPHASPLLTQAQRGTAEQSGNLAQSEKQTQSKNRAQSVELSPATFMPILPRLPRFIRAMAEQGATPLLATWQLLERSYQEFLQTHNLIEPSWAVYESSYQVALQTSKGAFSFFFPEAMRDFESLHPIMAHMGAHIQVFYTPDKSGEAANAIDATNASNTSNATSSAENHCTVYQSNHGREELWWVMSSIQQLLAQGVSQNDIAITLPQYEVWKEEVQDIADLLNIPITLTERSRLASSALGNLFVLLQRAVDKDFHIEELEKLFFCRAIPWKLAKELRLCIRELKESGVLSLSFDGGSSHAWENPFKIRYRSSHKDISEDEVQRVVQLLRSFFLQARDVVRSVTVKDLIQNIDDFYGNWLEFDKPTAGSAFDGASESLRSEQAVADLRRSKYMITTALQSLEAAYELKDTQQDLHITPYQFMVQLLSLASNSQPKVQGIRVAPYGDSVGVVPAHHFIPGASQSALGGIVQDKTDTLLGLSKEDTNSYANSMMHMYMQAGQRVYFSSSHKGFQDDEILYLPLAQFQQPLPEPVKPDILVQEQQLWWNFADQADTITPEATPKNVATPEAPEGATGFSAPEGTAKQLPPQIESSLLLQGLEYAWRTAFSKKQLNLTTMPIPEGELHNRVHARIPQVHTKPSVLNDGSAQGSTADWKAAHYRLSASAIDAFNACGFRYLFERLLGLDEVSQSVDIRSAMVEGNLLHRALELVLQRHFQEGGICYSEFAEVQATDSRITQALEQAVEENWGGHIPNYLKKELGLHGASLVQLALRTLAQRLPAYRPLFLEKELAITMQGIGSGEETPLRACSLYGIIDNLSISGDLLALIDYKRSGSSLSTITSIHKDGPEGSVQIPMYLSLLDSHENLHAEDSLILAGYYTLVKGEFKTVIAEKLYKMRGLEVDDDYFKNPNMQIVALKNRLRLVISRMITALDTGDFRVDSAYQGKEMPEHHCKSCLLRSVCRTRYVVE